MQKSSKRLRTQAFLVVLLMCRAAFGQVGSGDYDADYDVDGDDFANWAACMTGEQGSFVAPYVPLLND